MDTDILESTRLSDSEIDELCQGIVSSKDIQYADQIDELSIVENILNDDVIQQMNLSYVYSNNDISFENKLETNLILAEKNKLICEQEYKLSRLDRLVEVLMCQIQRFKLQEKRANHELSQSQCLLKQSQDENKKLKSKFRIYKAAVVKMSQNKSFKSESRTKKFEPDFCQSTNICFRWKQNGYCERESKCKF